MQNENKLQKSVFKFLKVKKIMQKKRFLLFMVVLAMVLLNPVNAQNFKVGLTVTPFGENDVLEKAGLVGGAGSSGDGFYTVGITCQIPIAYRLDVETGLEYSKHTIIISPNLPPGMDDTPFKSNVKLVSIPVTLKMNFLKYLFVNGGILLDLDANNSSQIDNQTGFVYNFSK